MPLDDAMILVKRNFDNYIAEMREKANRLPPAAALPAVAPIPTDYLPPDKHTHYLLNLLADGRVLTLEELDRVLGYLEDRRVKMLAKTAGPPRRPPGEISVMQLSVYFIQVTVYVCIVYGLHIH